MEHIFFQTTAVVSLIYAMEDGTTDETDLVGTKARLVSPSSWVVIRRPTKRCPGWRAVLSG
jgi:hypothetical protein